jgi:SNF2 family DNA or RNA helicase
MYVIAGLGKTVQVSAPIGCCLTRHILTFLTLEWQIAATLLALFGKTGRKIEDAAQNRIRRQEGIDLSSFPKGAPPIGSNAPPCLIIAPASLVKNWENELNLWGYFLIQTLTTRAHTVDEIFENANTGEEWTSS